MMNALLRRLALAGIVITGTATGPFTATVSGGMSETLHGQAIFQNVYVTGDSVPSLWWITLTAGGDADHRIQFSRARLGVPSVGHYSIADSRQVLPPAPERFDVMYEHGSSDAARNFSGRSGSLDITEATSTRVVGRFTFTAVPDDGDSTGAVTVSGRFTADRAPDRRK